MNKFSLLAAAAMVVSGFTAGAYAQTSNAHSNATMSSHTQGAQSDTARGPTQANPGNGVDTGDVASDDKVGANSGALAGSSAAGTADASGRWSAQQGAAPSSTADASSAPATPGATPGASADASGGVSDSDVGQQANNQAQATTAGAGTITADNGPVSARNDYPRCSRSVRDNCIQRGGR